MNEATLEQIEMAKLVEVQGINIENAVAIGLESHHVINSAIRKRERFQIESQDGTYLQCPWPSEHRVVTSECRKYGIEVSFLRSDGGIMEIHVGGECATFREGQHAGVYLYDEAMDVFAQMLREQQEAVLGAVVAYRGMADRVGKKIDGIRKRLQDAQKRYEREVTAALKGEELTARDVRKQGK